MMSTINKRQQELQQWINGCLGGTSVELTPLQNDASLRRFYRLNTVPTTVLMDAAADLKNQALLEATVLLQSNGIKTPKIFYHDLAIGLFQLEDFGDDLLLNYIGKAAIEPFLHQAVSIILKIQSIPTEELANLQVFDKVFIERELNLFTEWFVDKYIELQLSTPQQTIIDTMFDTIGHILLSQPYVAMHRDFHCGNIMVLPDQTLGILDFQDLMLGPLTYDLISLLKDRNIACSPDIFEKVLQEFYQAIHDKYDFKNYAEFIFYFDVTGLQRHLKILGGFSKIYLTRGNGYYLQFFDRILAYIVQVTAKYPQFEPFNRILTTVIIPQLFKA